MSRSGGGPTTPLVTVRRYRCTGCRHVWRQHTIKAAQPRARLARRALRWALEALVCQHLTVARIAEALGVSWTPSTTRSWPRAAGCCQRPDPLARRQGHRRGRALLAAHPPRRQIRHCHHRPLPDPRRHRPGFHHTPDGVDDRTAATLTIAGRTASAALAVVEPGPGDTVLIGGAAGGVGVFAVQLAVIAGARVIGTGSAPSGGFLRDLGAEPVTYGDGLADRVRALAPGGVTAAIDLHGTETAEVARELGVPDGRITTIATRIDGIRPANGAHATARDLDGLAHLVAAGRLRVPIAADFPIERIRTAVELQAGRHVKGKIVIDLGTRDPLGRPASKASRRRPGGNVVASSRLSGPTRDTSGE